MASPRHKTVLAETGRRQGVGERSLLSPYFSPLPGVPGLPRVLSARAHVDGVASKRSIASTSAALVGSKTALCISLGRYSLASAAGNLSARGTSGLQWSSLHGRPVLGKDCVPEVGQRVVGKADTAFKSMGLGTVVDLDGLARGFVAVSWDRQRGSARPPAEYCVGHKGIHLLELAQLEDIIFGQRYESQNGWQGAQQARSIEDIFSEPFGGPGRRRRFQFTNRPLTTGNLWKDPQTGDTTKREFLKRGQGLKGGLGNYQPSKVTQTLTDLFIRFAKGTKRKRTWGYNIEAVKVQTMQSLNLRELIHCLQYLDVRQEKPILRGLTPILSVKDIDTHYEQYAPWSHPDAFKELDFDRFALCLESIAVLVGVPFARFLCGISKESERERERERERARDTILVSMHSTWVEFKRLRFGRVES